MVVQRLAGEELKDVVGHLQVVPAVQATASGEPLPGAFVGPVVAAEASRAVVLARHAGDGIVSLSRPSRPELLGRLRPWDRR